MDKIHLKNMLFFGYHGAFSEENRLGQRFLVNVTLGADLKKAGKTDALNDTVNYAEVYKKIQQVMEGRPRKLLEKLAEDIADSLFSNFPLIVELTINVVKLHPPIENENIQVEVEITRRRDL